MACLNLFCKNILFISGRNIEFVYNVFQNKHAHGIKNYLYFLDYNGFTANYREGQWYYQKFHSQEQLKELLYRFGFEIVKMNFPRKGSSFQVMCRKVHELCNEEYIKAIDFEFNLPLPNNRNYNRHEDVKRALKL